MRASRLMLVGVGGAIGTALRASTEAALPATDRGVPIAVIGINLLGAFALGVVTGFAERTRSSDRMRTVLTVGVGVGVLGGFTSYSTMTAASAVAVDRDDAALGIGVLFALIAAGVLVAGLGYHLAAPPPEEAQARPLEERPRRGPP